MISALKRSLHVGALKIPIVCFLHSMLGWSDAVAARSVSVSLAADCGLIHLMAKRYPAKRVMENPRGTDLLDEESNLSDFELIIHMQKVFYKL